MNGFKLQPGDVLIYELEGYGILKPFACWLLGSKWGHVGLFWAWTKRGLPLTIESIGRGVLIRSLLSYQGCCIKVMRWKGDNASQVGLEVAKAAERIAGNPASWYDYFAIPRYVLPRLIWSKIAGRIKAGFGYRRNSFYICSELVAQSFFNAGYKVFHGFFIPLPGDFETSLLLAEVWCGKLSEEQV